MISRFILVMCWKSEIAGKSVNVIIVTEKKLGCYKKIKKFDSVS